MRSAYKTGLSCAAAAIGRFSFHSKSRVALLLWCCVKSCIYVHYSSLLTRFVQCHDKELGKYQKLLTSLLEAGMFGEALLDRNQLAHASRLSVNTVRKVLELCGKLVICKTDGRKYRYAIDLDYLDQAAEIDSGVPKTP